jgi:hydroxymethylbilane synthase
MGPEKKQSMTVERTIYLATRGSALALAQANAVLAKCRVAFPDRHFELKILKTTGDERPAASLSHGDEGSTKGLFTKELEVALLEGTADLAVHSLKDLPTELPEGLKLIAVLERSDPRDVLIHPSGKKFPQPVRSLRDLPAGCLIGTGSPRRQAQVLAAHPELKVTEIRGNVGTRLQKCADQSQCHAIILAAAGLARLGYRISLEGYLQGESVPEGLLAAVLNTDEMLPCVGQAAIGIETRQQDSFAEELCHWLNHPATECCVKAERAFLQAWGGGCRSPVAALATLQQDMLRLRAAAFTSTPPRHFKDEEDRSRPLQLGERVAAHLSRKEP